MDHQIRSYMPADLPDILSAWESASEIAHSFLPEPFLIQERAAIQNNYLPTAETWVIEAQGTVIGFLSLLDNEIGGLFVHAEHHQMGAGTALMGKAKQRHPVLEVEVFEKNLIGRKFYAKCGFNPISRHIHEQTGNALARLRFDSAEQGA
ncbi:MAG: GNAT family N-acetyltransferase [Aggregatilineales bacterium]